MVLWIVFIVLSFLLGLSISFLLDYPFRRLERALCSIVVGHTISLWIAFLIAYLTKSLSVEGTLVCIGLCTFGAILLLGWTMHLGKWRDSDFKATLADIWTADKCDLAFFSFMLLYVLFMNFYGVFRPDEAGNLVAFHTVWADYPWHTSLITTLVYQDTFSFPLTNPQFGHLETHYPLIMDFYSAVLMRGGLDLRNSILVPNILFHLTFFGLLYFLAYRLTDLKEAGIGATIIFILAGYPAGLQAANFHFLNPMYAVIMPQRTAIIGMAISFVVYLLLFYAFCAEKHEETHALRKKQRELLLAGVLIGLLPYIHAHSFIATGFVALCLATFLVVTDRDIKPIIFLLLPLLLLSLPQVLSIRSGVSEDFFVFFPGWTDANRNILVGFDWSSVGSSLLSAAKTAILIESFWALNVGGLLVLMALGFLKAKRETRIFYLPFLFLFVLANVVKFQPWYFDNYKLFIHWLVLTSILAALAVLGIRRDFTKTNKSNKSTVLTLSIAALLIASTFFGVVTHASMLQNTYMVWSGDELHMAEWVRDTTAPDSVFLTGTTHNHPLPSLTGRSRVMGYEGWLWSHGINGTIMHARKNDIKAMYQGNYTLMQDYGVDYVCIGPYERAFAQENHFTINDAAFDNKTRYSLKYDTEIAGERWQLYQVT